MESPAAALAELGSTLARRQGALLLKDGVNEEYAFYAEPLQLIVLSAPRRVFPGNQELSSLDSIDDRLPVLPYHQKISGRFEELAGRPRNRGQQLTDLSDEPFRELPSEWTGDLVQACIHDVNRGILRNLSHKRAPNGLFRCVRVYYHLVCLILAPLPTRLKANGNEFISRAVCEARIARGPDWLCPVSAS